MKRWPLCLVLLALTACADDGPTTVTQCHWRYTAYALVVTADTVATLTPFDSVLVCVEPPALRGT